MSTSQPNIAGQHAGASEADNTHRAGDDHARPAGPPNSKARRQEILTADPYYPHTGQRVIAHWLMYFFGSLGLMVFLNILMPVEGLEYPNLLLPVLFSSLSVGVQWLRRGARVHFLERTGRLSPEPATGESTRKAA